MASTTPLWLPLVTAIAGIIGTLGAAIFTQVWAGRREDQRRRQDKAREDRYRSYSERQSAYQDMLHSFHRWNDEIVVGWRFQQADDDLTEIMENLASLERECYRSFERVTLLAPPEVVHYVSRLARLAASKQARLLDGSLDDPDDEGTQNIWRLALNAMRIDLGVPGGLIGLPPRQPTGPDGAVDSTSKPQQAGS
ncbi:hypothetical protein [Micromonospora sp. NPDC004551]|uniref:hypothetical protein n=1 Tax=Micromonospora sp. NPDC004551 TaxID=3154284 RepID=UPI0033A45D7F